MQLTVFFLFKYGCNAHFSIEASKLQAAETINTKLQLNFRIVLMVAGMAYISVFTPCTKKAKKSSLVS